MHMFDFIRSMFDWQKNNTFTPIKGTKAVCLICLKDISVGETHKNCEVAFSNALPKCRLCSTAIFPGEPHVACNQMIVKNITSSWQCIICSHDEREGDHTQCLDTISSFKRELKMLKQI